MNELWLSASLVITLDPSQSLSLSSSRMQTIIDSVSHLRWEHTILNQKPTISATDTHHMSLI
ncbi:ANM_HP_G0101580.mRNA.1.CDS.1 [Saccharomyces cerevisiae]|nr:ANM_HP_G0101580.mRNA.1.CDS.1 [Saccharomyces cerevisiae]CAI6412785.1 ANM_HP_G0101580.mRNA.1.CDS.1 [Saccharomyces cerevisiae]